MIFLTFGRFRFRILRKSLKLFHELQNLQKCNLEGGSDLFENLYVIQCVNTLYCSTMYVILMKHVSGF